jgi:hypothetical protein
LEEVACARRPPRGGPAAELTPPCQARRAAPPAVMKNRSSAIPEGASPRRGATAGRVTAGSLTDVRDFLLREGIPSAAPSASRAGASGAGSSRGSGKGRPKAPVIAEGLLEGCSCEATFPTPVA